MEVHSWFYSDKQGKGILCTSYNDKYPRTSVTNAIVIAITLNGISSTNVISKPWIVSINVDKI